MFRFSDPRALSALSKVNASQQGETPHAKTEKVMHISSPSLTRYDKQFQNYINTNAIP
jgi:hypothetical protein